MNHKQKQIAEQFWKDYFYMTTDTPDKDTFIAFCENLADESRLLDAPVMPNEVVAGGNLSDPICGNCSKPLSKHLQYEKKWCYEKGEDEFNDTPSDWNLLSWI